jgi:hypothetical protein
MCVRFTSRCGTLKIDDERLWGGKYGRIEKKYARPQHLAVLPLLITSATARGRTDLELSIG